MLVFNLELRTGGRSFHGCAVIVMGAILIAALFTGCGKTHTEKAEPKTGSNDALREAVATPPETIVSDPDAIAVPDGTAEELIQFISDIAQKNPEGKTDEERIQSIARQMEARIVAAGKLMEKDGGTHRMLALQTKLESLRVLVAVGIQGAENRFQDLAKELTSSASDELQRLGRIGLYQGKLDALIVQGPRGSSSPENVVAALKDLLEQEKLDQAVLQAADETAQKFNQVGLTLESAEVFKLISEKFANHEDPDLAKSARVAAQQALMVGLSSQIRDFMRGNDKQALEKLTATVQQMEASAQLAGSLMSVAQNLEYSGQVDNSKALYELAAEITSKLEGEGLEPLKEMLGQAQTRLGLVGSEFTITGVKSDGSPFNWEDYAGKVVLVDFWATWCSPCIAEIPNVLVNYDRFHAAGFEVVGVNLDDDPSDARSFLEQRKLPWTTVISASDEARGFSDPNCVKCGVSGIPFLVLVGRDGKVDSLHLRGPRLAERLTELFPEDDKGAENAKGDEEGDVEVPTNQSDTDGATADPDAPQDATDILDEATETLPPDMSQGALNPYQAEEGLDSAGLVMYLLELNDKPASIQRRPGFVEAVSDVVDRILASNVSEAQKLMAARQKLKFLHEAACRGDERADSQLTQTIVDFRAAMAAALKDDLQFFELEQRSLSHQQDADDLVPLIDECTGYLEQAGAGLDTRHLRLASNTVDLINRLPADSRDARFERVAQALMQSPARDVARYGKTLLVGGGKTGPTVGQTIALQCTTVDGQQLSLADFREDVVLIEFWATWCGACRKLQPQLDALLEKHPDVELISICLDAQESTLEEFLEENHPRGFIVFGEDAQQSAKSFAVRSIPAIFVVDPESRLHHIARSTDHLSEMILKLSGKQDN